MPVPQSLEAIPIGAPAQVAGFATGISAARSGAMGLRPGIQITILQRGPHQSFIVRAGQQRLALRANEAAAVLVERSAQEA